jgi:hypothetical protein
LNDMFIELNNNASIEHLQVFLLFICGTFTAATTSSSLVEVKR